jgi:hypothetical protein
VSAPLRVEISDLAMAQVRAAEEWWRKNRPKAPNAVREELERAAVLISLQPEVELSRGTFCSPECDAST